MNRTIHVGGLIAIAFAIIGSCGEDGDRCLPYPPCDPEEPVPVNVLIAEAEVFPDLVDSIIAYSAQKGLFPEGSRLQAVSLIDSVPPLEELQQFDAVLVYTVALLAWPEQNDSIGDILADYVDGGGGLVMCQWSMTQGSAGLHGRLRTPGYCPFRSGPAANINDERTIDIDSIQFPLHPIFYGIDVRTITFPGWLNIPHPDLDDSAILLAKDQFGANTIAINTKGNIIGLNTWPSFIFCSRHHYAEAAKLIANSLMFVAGPKQRGI